MDVPLRWVAALDADTDTNYRIEYNGNTPGLFEVITTLDSTNRGDGAYTPYTATLVGDIAAGAASIAFDGVTGFTDGNYAMIDREMFLLGGLSGTTFAACAGGQGNTRRRPHYNGATIYKAHETYTHAGVTAFATRSAIRYHIIREQGADQSLAREILAVQPTLSSTAEFSAVWHVFQDAQGNPQANVPVTMTLLRNDLYDPGTLEGFYRDAESVVTDADGYFQFFLPIFAVDLEEGETIATITVAPGVTNTEKTWNITALPTTPAVHLLELVTGV